MAPEIYYGIGAILILGGLVWGLVSYATRNKARDAASERKTREVMSNPGKDGDVPDPPPAPLSGPGRQ